MQNSLVGRHMFDIDTKSAVAPIKQLMWMLEIGLVSTDARDDHNNRSSVIANLDGGTRLVGRCGVHAGNRTLRATFAFKAKTYGLIRRLLDDAYIRRMLAGHRIRIV